MTGNSQSAKTSRITIYTDGACSGNPGPGGWGAILISGNHRKEINGGDPATTNNRMELQAAVSALGQLKVPSCVDIYTDSNYVRDGITRWIRNWKRNGWKTAAKKPVKNEDLWRELDDAAARHEIEWHWVKGHAGDPENERADELARQGVTSAKSGSLSAGPAPGA